MRAAAGVGDALGHLTYTLVECIRSTQNSDALNIARRLARATLRRVRCAARALRHRPIAPLDRALIIRVIKRNACPYKKTRLFFTRAFPMFVPSLSW